MGKVSKEKSSPDSELEGSHKKTLFKDANAIQNKSSPVKKSRSKKRKPKKSEDCDNIVESSSEISLKNKPRIESINKDDEIKDDDDETVTKESTKKNKRAQRNNEVQSSLKHNKKIKFMNDDPVAVNSKTNSLKKKKRLNDDEEEVRDEDIDAFCDELDEKDNEVYENWVKLFEDNFRSNKKKL